MSSGYMGKLLWVDLTNGKLEDQSLNEQECQDYIGGYGLGAKILYDRMKPGVDPLGPDNILGLLTGPLTGTPAIEGNRFVVVCKSPLTDTWGDANCGATFGPHLKFAGYDGVIVTGQSEKPVYVYINNGKAELRDASDLWGKDVTDTEDTLRARHGKDTETASIGPAGEKLSLISAVMNDYGRAAGRSGVGAVMGSKTLKAIAVQGNQKVPLADEEKCNELRRVYMKKTGGNYSFFSTTGTIGITGPSAMSGDSPVKNWAGSGVKDFPSAEEQFKPERLMEWQTRKYGCWRCTMACGGHMDTTPGDAPYEGIKAHKVEYETAAAFGTMTLNDNFPSLIKANDICNRYGLDTISAGCTLAFAIECYENGIISKEDTGGIELTWGNHEAEIAILELLAKREGFGDILADGVKVAAERIGRGSEEYAIHIQGQEVPMHDPKFEPGLATTYKMDATPARHTQGGEFVVPVNVDVGKWDKYQYSGKGEIHRKLAALMHVVNASGLCAFAVESYDFHWVPDFLTAVTGREWTLDDIYKAGDRIGNLRHAFNLREGLNPIEFKVPKRLLGDPPLTHGNVRGITVDIDTQVREYCEAMGWDPQTARPNRQRLAELGLEFIADDLGIG